MMKRRLIKFVLRFIKRRRWYWHCDRCQFCKSYLCRSCGVSVLGFDDKGDDVPVFCDDCLYGRNKK